VSGTLTIVWLCAAIAAAVFARDDSFPPSRLAGRSADSPPTSVSRQSDRDYLGADSDRDRVSRRHASLEDDLCSSEAAKLRIQGLNLTSSSVRIVGKGSKQRDRLCGSPGQPVH